MWIPGGKLWRLYQDEVVCALSSTDTAAPQTFCPDQIQKLPIPLQNYLYICGYLERPQMCNVCICFYNAECRLSPRQKPMRIFYQQHSFIRQPQHFSYMDTRFFGIPFQVKNTYTDGIGSKKGMLAKKIPLFGIAGPETDQSLLLSLLSTAIFMPSLFLTGHISWTPIDDYSLKGKISINGREAEGIFLFNDLGEIIRFESTSQYDNGKETISIPWVVEPGDYREKNGIRCPHALKVLRRLENEDFVYFSCRDIDIAYDLHIYDPLDQPDRQFSQAAP